MFTKETLIMNATAEALFDNFYLGWALDLDVVRKQWAESCSCRQTVRILVTDTERF